MKADQSGVGNGKTQMFSAKKIYFVGITLVTNWMHSFLRKENILNSRAIIFFGLDLYNGICVLKYIWNIRNIFNWPIIQPIKCLLLWLLNMSPFSLIHCLRLKRSGKFGIFQKISFENYSCGKFPKTMGGTLRGFYLFS